MNDRKDRILMIVLLIILVPLLATWGYFMLITHGH
jgi:hypothetical protein